MCGGDLNVDGELVTLVFHPCYPAGDEELERISKLPELTELALSAERVTDEGLTHLAAMPKLKVVQLHEAERISDSALADLRLRRPSLKVAIE